MAQQLNSQFLNLKIDTEDLSPEQIRLIKSINSMILDVMTTKDEDIFFEGSAEFMRMCASMIKQANFNRNLKTAENIPYAEQALEYSVDILQDYMTTSKVISYDN